MSDREIKALTGVGVAALLAGGWALWFAWGPLIALDGMMAFCF